MLRSIVRPHGFSLAAAFVVLNLGDWLLTRWLVGDLDGQVVEGNPVAASILSRFGWCGLAVYKTTTVAVMLAATALLAGRRPVLARRLRGGGCVVMLLLIGYQLTLAALQPWDDEDQRFLKAVHQESMAIQRIQDDSRALHRCIHEQADELAAGRVNLSEAIAVVVDEFSRHPRARCYMPYSGYDQEACLALTVLAQAASRLEGGDCRQLRRLVAEFEAIYQRPIPDVLQLSTESLAPSAVHRQPAGDKVL